MMRTAKVKLAWWLPPAILLGLVLSCLASQVVFTLVILGWARGEGVYPTPEEGAIQRANRYYCGVEKVEIEHATTNSFDGSNPHIWYVIWQVYAHNRVPCDPAKPGAALYYGDHEKGGSFYLNVRQGWVYMPEGYFPEWIGFWMKVLRLAGPGDPRHIPRE